MASLWNSINPFAKKTPNKEYQDEVVRLLEKIYKKRSSIGGGRFYTPSWDGASRTSKSLRGNLYSINYHLNSDLRYLKSSAMKASKNNPSLKKAIETHAHATTPITVTLITKNKRLKKLWLDWSQDRQKFSLDGRQNFKSIQWMLMREMLDSGEAMFKKNFVKGELLIQSLESVILDQYQHRG